VDDDVELRKALTKVLQLEGYTVVAQPDAVNALQCLEAGERFDLVITDLSMPGMRGTSLLTAVKTAFPGVPVILITAFGDWDVYAEALREGVFEFLNKPLDREELLACIRRALSPTTKESPSCQ
jgi:DNA-binding NtrC family response regulator